MRCRFSSRPRAEVGAIVAFLLTRYLYRASGCWIVRDGGLRMERLSLTGTIEIIAAAGDMLKKVRPFVTRFAGSGSDYIEQMARGNICAVVGWSGDIMIAKNKSAQAKKPQNLQVLLPKTGGLLFFDTMAIPKDAPNADNAHAFINYILKPEVHASLTNAVFYANPNKASLPFVKPEIAKDKAVFVDEAGLATMIPPGAPEQATRRLVTRTFTNFKANR